MLIGIHVDGRIYFVYKFFRVKTFKSIIVFRGNIKNQWPILYDSGGGTFYSDVMEIKDIGQNLMTIWIIKIEKTFKIGVEG
jgi:hypothetical protein